jgi:hypothetical protein
MNTTPAAWIPGNNGEHRCQTQRQQIVPTFRAKGVVNEVIQLEKTSPGDKDMFVAEVEIGKYIYKFPVCRNVKRGDVLVIKIGVINL